MDPELALRATSLWGMEGTASANPGEQTAERGLCEQPGLQGGRAGLEGQGSQRS